jgi:hypothetical protein
MGCILHLCQPLFGGAEGKAIAFGDGFYGLAVLVEWANVAELYRDAVLLVEPAQRQTLRATHVGAMLVDAASACLVEERAASRGVGNAFVEERSVVRANRCCLHLEHREIVLAAPAAPFGAVQALRMENVEVACAALHFGVERADGLAGQRGTVRRGRRFGTWCELVRALTKSRLRRGVC